VDDDDFPDSALPSRGSPDSRAHFGGNERSYQSVNSADSRRSSAARGQFGSVGSAGGGGSSVLSNIEPIHPSQVAFPRLLDQEKLPKDTLGLIKKNSMSTESVRALSRGDSSLQIIKPTAMKRMSSINYN
jgi:hypothetical protein